MKSNRNDKVSFAVARVKAMSLRWSSLGRWAAVATTLVLLTAGVSFASFSLTFQGLAQTLTIGGSITISAPAGTVVDPAGDIFLVDTGNNRIVEVNAQGAAAVLTISGLSPSLSSPSGIAIDWSGNLYIADTGNSRVVKITPSGIGTVVSTGSVTLQFAARRRSGSVGKHFHRGHHQQPHRRSAVERIGCGAYDHCIVGHIDAQRAEGPRRKHGGQVVHRGFGQQSHRDTGAGQHDGRRAEHSRRRDAEQSERGRGRSHRQRRHRGHGQRSHRGDRHLEQWNGAVYRFDDADRAFSRCGRSTRYGLHRRYRSQPNRLSPLRPVNADLTSSDPTYSLNQSVVQFGHVQLGSSTAVSLTLQFTTGSVGLGAVKVLTRGTQNLDFISGSGTTCNSSTTASTSCSVQVNFLPTAAGLRDGAVVLFDTSLNPILTLPLYGWGDAPLAALSPNTASVVSTALDRYFQSISSGAGWRGQHLCCELHRKEPGQNSDRWRRGDDGGSRNSRQPCHTKSYRRGD